MLSAVPTQKPSEVPPLPARPGRVDAFVHRVQDAIENLSGTEAVDQITRLYEADVNALTAQANTCAHESTTAAASMRMQFDMLQQVHTVASQRLAQLAEATAEVAQYRDIVAAVRSLTERADGKPIDPTVIASKLATTPVGPIHIPTTTAFVSSGLFRGGRFVGTDGVWMAFTFIGWALIDYGPGAQGQVEPVFLVNNRAMSKSLIEEQHRVTFDRYLPVRLDTVRAA